MESWEQTVERVLAVLNAQRERHEQGQKTDVQICLGRTDRETGRVRSAEIHLHQFH